MYSEGLYQQYKYLATWLPNTNVKLGDIGLLKGALWARSGEIPPSASKLTVRQGARIPSLEWQNTNKFVMETKAAGELAPGFTALAMMDGGIAYRFDKAGAIIFRAEDIVAEEVADTARIRRWMLNEHRAGRLDPGSVAVTRVLRAKSFIVLITNSDGARVEMRTAATVGPASNTAAAVRGRLEIARATGMFVHLVVENGVPLFGGLRLRKSLLRKPRVDDVLLDADVDDATAQVATEGLHDDDPFELIGLA
ncbi:hypothetical protein [Streptomyces regalis]|uniref:Uncharacterized protein n=1 Tax=Streptomyces regalis TaxID=68262 RepID=A0A0X3VH01_9ACTN|nr:hypothetical protein [Streptomyces regalis]KUL44079.1 hypothetical protein ADL12_05920 [Streptomyces regalis]